mmetsp:Transcript_31080/g.51953  ORF Transcript_31080/g.51953 Transcript_31080/m.51953 type:complete len:286 (-) Transcript_31080:2388-3245(-)
MLSADTDVECWIRWPSLLLLILPSILELFLLILLSLLLLLLLLLLLVPRPLLLLIRLVLVQLLLLVILFALVLAAEVICICVLGCPCRALAFDFRFSFVNLGSPFCLWFLEVAVLSASIIGAPEVMSTMEVAPLMSRRGMLAESEAPAVSAALQPTSSPNSPNPLEAAVPSSSRLIPGRALTLSTSELFEAIALISMPLIPLIDALNPCLRILRLKEPSSLLLLLPVLMPLTLDRRSVLLLLLLLPIFKLLAFLLLLLLLLRLSRGSANVGRFLEAKLACCAEAY